MEQSKNDGRLDGHNNAHTETDTLTQMVDGNSALIVSSAFRQIIWKWPNIEDVNIQLSQTVIYAPQQTWKTFHSTEEL